MYLTNNEDKIQILDNKLYISRIEELNELIGKLSEENYKLKKLLSKKQETYVKLYICKYTPYMVSDVIYNNFFVKISSHTITKVAEENNFFDDEIKAIRIPRKKNSKEKYASTVLFSIVGIAELTYILANKFSIDLTISQNYFEKSVNQLKKGEIKHYTINELKAMEK